MKKPSFYLFAQNNSGEYYKVDFTIAHIVIFEADNYDEANRLAESKGVFNYPFCSCCGERFSRLSKDSEAYKSIKSAINAADWMRDRQGGVKVRVHRKNGKVVYR